MIILPKDSPEYRNLNSYYINIQRLIEHLQGEFGAGCIHFQSTVAEGVVFFDSDEILGGAFLQNGEESAGLAAVDQLVTVAETTNLSIDIYRIDPMIIYFWANMPDAKTLHRDLSAEFTDLNALIKKMHAEKLTGFIDVTIGNGNAGSILYFNNGTPFGASHTWMTAEKGNLKQALQQLVRKVKKEGGAFSVSRIPVPGPKKSSGAAESAVNMDEVLEIVEALLNDLGGLIQSNKNRALSFETLLKKKFIEKADSYAFLDPFASEFTYKNEKVSFSGTARAEELCRGIMASVVDLIDELGNPKPLSDIYSSWTGQNAGLLEKMGLSGTAVNHRR